MTQQVNLRYEYELQAQGYTAIAGLDEAGRGAWAGPVVAGAVILPMARFDLARALDGVNDSKQLAPQDRANLLPRILNVAVASGVGYASSTEIDQVGIVPATHRAMQRALAQLSIPPDALLIDSLCLPGNNLPCIAITKGDQKSLSIAAASILAKVTRDGMMKDRKSVV
jgi:ribonuclease HII